MSRYIDADLAIDEIIKDMCGVSDIDEGLSTAISELRLMSTADVVEVVHGDWIKNWEIGWSACSHCGKGYLWEDYKGVADWNYCPNCGARMDGGRDDKQKSD